MNQKLIIDSALMVFSAGSALGAFLIWKTPKDKKQDKLIKKMTEKMPDDKPVKRFFKWNHSVADDFEREKTLTPEYKMIIKTFGSFIEGANIARVKLEMIGSVLQDHGFFKGLNNQKDDAQSVTEFMRECSSSIKNFDQYQEKSNQFLNDSIVSMENAMRYLNEIPNSPLKSELAKNMEAFAQSMVPFTCLSMDAQDSPVSIENKISSIIERSRNINEENEFFLKENPSFSHINERKQTLKNGYNNKDIYQIMRIVNSLSEIRLASEKAAFNDGIPKISHFAMMKLNKNISSNIREVKSLMVDGDKDAIFKGLDALMVSLDRSEVFDNLTIRGGMSEDVLNENKKIILDVARDFGCPLNDSQQACSAVKCNQNVTSSSL